MTTFVPPNPADVPKPASEVNLLRQEVELLTGQRDAWRDRAIKAQQSLGHNRAATNSVGQQVVVMRLRLNRLAQLAVAVANGGSPQARGILLDYLQECGYPTVAWTDPIDERSKP